MGKDKAKALEYLDQAIESSRQIEPPYGSMGNSEAIGRIRGCLTLALIYTLKIKEGSSE